MKILERQHLVSGVYPGDQLKGARLYDATGGKAIKQAAYIALNLMEVLRINCRRPQINCTQDISRSILKYKGSH